MNIEIEVKNVYPVERNDQKQFVKGGLHVTITLGDVEGEINLRGVLFSKTKEKYFFRLPFKSGISHETKLSVQYPIFSFSNDELNKTVIDAIYQKAPAVIESFLVNNPQTSEPMKQPEKTTPKPKVFVTPPPVSKKQEVQRKSYAR
jgi:hypothetical protein